ncbi:MAG: response regulator [Planctomycetota bacterium]
MSSILVIDDEPGSRLIVQSRLKDAGHRTSIADTGAKGLSEARAGAFDVLLVAAGLESGIDGGEVCRRLKAMPETQSTPVVLYCGRPVSADELTRGYEAGAEYYLSKTEMPVLDHIVRVLLAMKARQDDMAEQLRGLEGQTRRQQEERQRAAETELSESDQNLIFRDLAAGHPDGILVVGSEGFVRQADRGACELLGNRLEGKNLGSLAPASGLEAFVRDARSDVREGFRFDLAGRKGRSPRSLTASVVPLVSPPGEQDPGLRVVRRGRPG